LEVWFVVKERRVIEREGGGQIVIREEGREQWSQIIWVGRPRERERESHTGINLLAWEVRRLVLTARMRTVSTSPPPPSSPSLSSSPLELPNPCLNLSLAVRGPTLVQCTYCKGDRRSAILSLELLLKVESCQGEWGTAWGRRRREREQRDLDESTVPELVIAISWFFVSKLVESSLTNNKISSRQAIWLFKPWVIL
jgi:hypothetical protein